VPVLEGVIPALITPVNREGQVDHGALRQLVQRLVERGVTGISPLGSTGEGYSLGLDARLAVTETVAGAVPDGMPVIPGLFAANHEQAATEIAAYAGHGGTGVLLAPPVYYPLSPAEQHAYFARVADESALPLVLYNIPPFTKVQLAPPVVASLAGHERIAGIKDSGRDLDYATTLLDAVAASGHAAGFSVLTGIDWLLVSYLTYGARGTICGNANVVPELVVAVYDAFKAGQLDEARRQETQLRAVTQVLSRGTLAAGFKAAVAAAGVGERWLIPPRQALTDDEAAEVAKQLGDLGVG
jgi:dihydrodipicolinate synthase/N-acetylneuraminate lyase